MQFTDSHKAIISPLNWAHINHNAHFSFFESLWMNNGAECVISHPHSCSSEAGAKTVSSLNGLMCFLIKFPDCMDRPACLSLADSDTAIDKRESV